MDPSKSHAWTSSLDNLGQFGVLGVVSSTVGKSPQLESHGNTDGFVSKRILDTQNRWFLVAALFHSGAISLETKGTGCLGASCLRPRCFGGHPFQVGLKGTEPRIHPFDGVPSL